MRLLVVGQGIRPTGYGRVAESLLERLYSSFDASLFATNYRGTPPSRPFAVYTNRLTGDVYGREQLPTLLDRLRPQIVLLHHDTPFYGVHRPALDAYRRHHAAARVVVYCPVDWPRLPSGVATVFRGVDALVLYTEFGRRVLQRAYDDAGLAPPPLAIVPHGIDARRFKQLVPGDRSASRALARRALFGSRRDLDNAFIVLNANRNTRRKRIDLTVRAFALFARDRPDARLYLHMSMCDSGCDVLRLIADMGIEDRVLTTTRDSAPPAVTDEQLNLVYNACDIGVNTCEAEGWGMISFEHAATGAAQVVPAHSACIELWRDTAWVVPATPSVAGGHAVAPKDVAVALARFYSDPALREEMARRAQSLATSPQFTWDAIAEEWERVLARPAA